MRVYVISTRDSYELPCAVLNTLTECSEWLNVSRETIKTALRRHKIYKGKKFQVERVQIDK